MWMVVVIKQFGSNTTTHMDEENARNVFDDAVKRRRDVLAAFLQSPRGAIVEIYGSPELKTSSKDVMRTCLTLTAHGARIWLMPCPRCGSYAKRSKR